MPDFYPDIPTASGQPEEARQPRPGSGRAHATPTAHGHGNPPSTSGSGAGVPWALTGVLGGAALGATAAGPLGAILLGIVGVMAGLFRDMTGKSVGQAFLDMPEAEQRRMLQSAGFALASAGTAMPAECPPRGGAAAAAPSGRAAAAAPAPGSGAASGGLSVAQLRALRPSVAAPGEACCVVCAENAVQVVFQPCGHAQVCGSCAARILELGYTGACPVCRTKIQQVSRVYIAPSAAPPRPAAATPAPAAASAPAAPNSSSAAAAARRMPEPPVPEKAAVPSAPPAPWGQW